MDLGLGRATVVLQGGTQGMGRAAADCFAAEDARVAVLARTSADVERVTAELAELGAADTALAPDEILVNTVSLGSVSSEGLQAWSQSVGIDPDGQYAVMAGIAEHFGHPVHLPRAGLPGEIGPVIAFLCSRRHSQMTGANVNVDRGSDFC